MNKAGTFNPAMMVHGTEGIELYGEIPAEGEIESVGEITGIWDKGKAGVIEFESTSKLVSTREPLLKVKMSLICRGEGGFGGERGPSVQFERCSILSAGAIRVVSRRWTDDSRSR